MVTETTTDTAPSAETPSEFEDAFAAFASGETPAPADDAATDGDDDGKPDDKDPAEPAPDAAPAPGPADAAPSGPAAEADEIDWSAVPPAVRTAYEKIQHEAKSLRGRVSAADRTLHQLRTRPAPQAPQGTDKAPAKPALTEEQIAQLRDDYPDVAGPILDMMESLRADVAGVRQQDEETREAAILAANVADLGEVMPDWQQWGSDQRFETWITTQPRHIQEAAGRNSQHIVDVGEAHDVLSRFKAAHSAAAPAPTPNPRRDRQLRAGGDATTRQPATVTDVPDDFDAAFKAHAKKIEAKGPTR